MVDNNEVSCACMQLLKTINFVSSSRLVVLLTEASLCSEAESDEDMLLLWLKLTEVSRCSSCRDVSVKLLGCSGVDVLK